MINGKEVIQKQLEISETTEFASGGYKLNLTPAKLTPVPDISKILLDGEWSVKYYPFDEKKDIIGNDTDGWGKIIQPGKVFYADPEAEKDDIPDWNRVSLSHIDEKDGAVLTRKISIPADWKDKIIFLRFDAIYPAGIIYVNGLKIGEHFSGLTPFETKLDEVKAGDEITVVIRLLRKHKFVRMDMPRHALEFAGMSQSAYLFAVPKSFIKDYHLITEIDHSLSKGRIFGTVTIENPGEGKLSVSLLDHGEMVTGYECDVKKEKNTYTIDLRVNKPKLWNDEYPNLYDVLIKSRGTIQPCQRKPEIHRYLEAAQYQRLLANS